MKAYTLHFTTNTVKHKSFICRYAYRTNTGLICSFINKFVPAIKFSHHTVKIGTLWTPKFSICYIHLRVHASDLVYLRITLSRNLSSKVHNRYFCTKSFHIFVSMHMSIYCNVCIPITDIVCSYVCTPAVYICITSHYQCHRAIYSAARIPTAALFYIIQLHFNGVVLSILIDIWSRVNTECIISIRPISGFVTININSRFTHCTIKLQYCSTIFRRNVESSLVKSFTNPWQCTRTSALLCLFLLAILCYGNSLQVPFLIKWSTDSPVMWHSHLLPFCVIAAKLPFVNVNLSAYLRKTGSRD